MSANQFLSLKSSDAFAITSSDTLDVKDDPNNPNGYTMCYVHNPAAGGTVRVMPAAQSSPAGFTLTGTSGTANITINGTAYLVTFSSSLTTTATNFVSTHTTSLSALNIKVRSTSTKLVFTGAVNSTIAIANATGDLSGTALADTPVTIYIAQGEESSIAVRRVYATTPTPPVGLIAYVGKDNI